MAKFSKGASVKQIVTPITGTVEGFQVDQETGDIMVLVAWNDEDGDHSRYFSEDDLDAA